MGRAGNKGVSGIARSGGKSFCQKKKQPQTTAPRLLREEEKIAEFLESQVMGLVWSTEV